MSDSASATRPTSGARFLLDLTSEADAPRATYRVTIFTPDAEHTAAATLADDGSVEVPPTGAATELDDTLVMFARLVARGAAKRRTDGLPAWPQRVLRWRGPGRGT